MSLIMKNTKKLGKMRRPRGLIHLNEQHIMDIVALLAKSETTD
jgi:hypothetical protein